MAEYIEKTQLIEKLKHRVSTDDDSKFATGFIKGTNEALGIIEEWIASIPAADVAPVVHARWEMKSEDTTPGIYHVKKAFCTRCGKSNKQYRPPYCPHCGAKMDEVSSDE